MDEEWKAGVSDWLRELKAENNQLKERLDALNHELKEAYFNPNTIYSKLYRVEDQVESMWNEYTECRRSRVAELKAWREEEERKENGWPRKLLRKVLFVPRVQND